jgi:hypothetical protein
MLTVSAGLTGAVENTTMYGIGAIVPWVLNLALLTTAAAAAEPPATDPAPSSASITYAIDTMFGSHLTATVDGRTYTIVAKTEERCLFLEDIRDYDEDGLPDALIREGITCGGNGAGFSFFFVGYGGDGWFKPSDSFGDDAVWRDPVVAPWKNTWSVVVIIQNEGYGLGPRQSVQARYGFAAGAAVLLERLERMELVALTEIRSEAFKDKPVNEAQHLRFDLNGDGAEESIECTLWERWGLLQGTLKNAAGKTVGHMQSLCGKRIGVLASKTLGYHDLVIDHDTVCRWNGKHYGDDAQRQKCSPAKCD